MFQSYPDKNTMTVSNGPILHLASTVHISWNLGLRLIVSRGWAGGSGVLVIARRVWRTIALLLRSIRATAILRLLVCWLRLLLSEIAAVMRLQASASSEGQESEAEEEEDGDAYTDADAGPIGQRGATLEAIAIDPTIRSDAHRQFRHEDEDSNCSQHCTSIQL